MDQGLKILVLFVIIGYLGMTRLQIWWKKRGELTANRFALFQMVYWNSLRYSNPSGFSDFDRIHCHCPWYDYYFMDCWISIRPLDI